MEIGSSTDVLRYRAAIDVIEQLALNLRTIRRGDFPPAAKQRIREILRLSAEAVNILERQLRTSR